MPREPFEQLWATAVDRKGEDALNARFYDVDQGGHGDDRWLAAMAKHVFAAGFRWRVIEAKWDGFEEAFEHFDPATVAAFDEERIDALGRDTRIVRNGQKIVATVENARFVQRIAAEHGSFDGWIAGWPSDDVVGLWRALEQGGARLGGATGPRTLRSMGKDTFILTPDVVYALTEQGVLTGKPTSKKQQDLAQEAFNAWSEESGRPMSQVSIVIACTVDRPAEDED